MAPLLLPSLDSEPVTLATAQHAVAITHWSRMSTSFRQLSSNPAKCHCLDGSPAVFKSSCQGVGMQLIEACLAHTKPWVQMLAQYKLGIVVHANRPCTWHVKADIQDHLQLCNKLEASLICKRLYFDVKKTLLFRISISE